MYRPFKKMIAVLLAIWLPLFSGNALAISAVMHEKAQCLPAAMQQEDGHAMHDHLAAGHDSRDGHEAQHTSPCEDCGVCHFACSGYLAAPTAQTAGAQAEHSPFIALAAQFRSTILTPPVPPPLARS